SRFSKTRSRNLQRKGSQRACKNDLLNKRSSFRSFHTWQRGLFQKCSKTDSLIACPRRLIRKSLVIVGLPLPPASTEMMGKYRLAHTSLLPGRSPRPLLYPGNEIYSAT